MRRSYWAPWERLQADEALYQKNSRILRIISCNEVLVNGEFSSMGMLKFFTEENIDLTAHLARNRIAETDDGTKTQRSHLSWNHQSPVENTIKGGSRAGIASEPPLMATINRWCHHFFDFLSMFSHFSFLLATIRSSNEESLFDLISPFPAWKAK